MIAATYKLQEAVYIFSTDWAVKEKEKSLPDGQDERIRCTRLKISIDWFAIDVHQFLL